MWATTADATLPCRCPSSPLRRCGPSTMRLASWSSAAATMPFHVGAASTATLRAAKPAWRASSAPWAAVRSAARRTSVARSASKCSRIGGGEPDVDRLPDTDHQRVAFGRQLGRGLRDRERGEFGSVVGDQHRCRRLGALPSASAALGGRRRRPSRSAPCAGPDSGQQRRRVPGRVVAVEELVEVGPLRPGAAQRVDGHPEDGTADREAEADPQRVAGADRRDRSTPSARSGPGSARP